MALARSPEDPPQPAAQSLGPVGFLRQALQMMRPYRARLLIFLIAIVVQVMFYFSLPIFYREVFDRAIPNQDLRYLGWITLVIAGLFVIHVLAEWTDGVIGARLAADVMRNLRLHMYKHLQQLPLGFYARTSVGDLLSRFTNDLAMVEQALSASFYRVIFHALALLAGTVLLFAFEWRLALITLLSFPLGMIGPKLLSKKAGKAATRRKEEDARMMGMLQENVLAQKIIRAFALQASYLEKAMVRLGMLHTRSEALHKTTTFIGKSSSLGVLLIQLLVLLGGAYLAIAGYLTGGTLVGFLALLSGMGNSARVLTGTASELVQAAAGLQRVNELLNETPAPQIHRTVALQKFQREIRFENVTFSYTGDAPNLNQVSFVIPAGKSVAFVGRSGSGKSTVLNLIARFYETSEGTIAIDGEDVNRISEEALRTQIGTVFQDTFLFNTTIRENIRQGRLDATDEEVEAAAKAAEIHAFILSLPNGYDTEAGEMGGRFSGGQRQRIAIARAILRDPSILVLDEATSALDPATEVAINATLEKLSRNRTVIAVTHRLSSAVNLDGIFVMDQGRLVEQGTHKELLNQKGLYYDMWQDFALEMTQDAVMGTVASQVEDVAEIDTNMSPEALARRVRELESTVRTQQQETERLRAINLRWAQLAGTDRLTGLPNKLSFVQALLPQEIQQAQRGGHAMGFMLISGDNLGPINERFGRDAGDAAIRDLADCLQSMLKGEELLGHLDGVNFAVALFPATLLDAQARAETIRKSVAAHAFSAGGQQVDLTVSIGVAALDSAAITDPKQAAESVFDALNGALYAAKRAGGNRVASVDVPA